MKEWLDYHLAVGVDHFYLYDQDGGDDVRKILEPYEKKGQVTRHLWTMWDGTKYDGPTKFYQRNKNHMGFTHAAKNYKSDFQWLMKIDVDEFLYPLNDLRNLTKWLKNIDVKKVKGVRIPRINFGNNNHIEKPGLPLLQAYTKRELTFSNYKDLANGDFLSDNRYAYSSHWWHYKLFSGGKLLKNPSEIGLRINHYYTKSKNEFIDRQNVCQGRPVGEEGFYEKNAGCNEVLDEGMLRFLP